MHLRNAKCGTGCVHRIEGLWMKDGEMQCRIVDYVWCRRAISSIVIWYDCDGLCNDCQLPAGRGRCRREADPFPVDEDTLQLGTILECIRWRQGKHRYTRAKNEDALQAS